jgi:hypothetical protein
MSANCSPREPAESANCRCGIVLGCQTRTNGVRLASLVRTDDRVIVSSHISGEEVHEHVVSRHQIDQLGSLRLIKFASLYFASLTRPAIAQLNSAKSPPSTQDGITKASTREKRDCAEGGTTKGPASSMKIRM